MSTPKQSALDKAKKQDKKQNKKQQKVIENKASKPTCQQEEEDYELPYEEFGQESSTEPSWEDVREMEELHNNDTDSNINPCLQSSSEDLLVSDLQDGINEDTNKSILPPPTMPNYAYSYCPSNGIVYRVTLVDGKPVGQTFDHYYGSKPGELGLKH